MPIEQLPIFTYYDKQRFIQAGAMDCANWYGIGGEGFKNVQAMYPAMGRAHISFLNVNRLVFDREARAFFKTLNYLYIIVGVEVIVVDKFYKEEVIGTVALTGDLWFEWLAVGTQVYAMLTDEMQVHLITENGTTITMESVTDPNAPTKPNYIGVFGNRFVVSQKDTPDFYLSTINVDGGAAGCFTINGTALTNRASGKIRQFGVLHNQLYIFTDFTTDVWANIPTSITVAGTTVSFPWKENTSYNFNYGIAEPGSLAVGFGMMVWLATNEDGLVSFMVSSGGQPKEISTQAIDTLLQKNTSDDGAVPFLNGFTQGFLYEYENSIFYRVVAGLFLDFDKYDLEDSANALEYNFDIGKWARVIELDGARNRIQKHIYFNNKHLVIVADDPAIYEMAGDLYRNELRNPNQTNPQADDAFIKYPMRYELTTKQLFLPDYSEFVDDYVEIDFVFGDQTFYKSNAPFLNTTFIVTEDSTPESPIYVITEDGDFVIEDGTNTPTFDDNHYNALFKPHIELYYSDNGGISFHSADVREFSPLGEYRWRMRWYELGPSRNRCYKLVCVSSAPIVILGAVRNTRRVSGGAN